MRLAKLLAIKSYLTPVPIDYVNLEFGAIQLFARSVSRHDKPVKNLSNEELEKNSQKPWLVYLQGGPGYGCSPPQDFILTNAILDKGYQILYLDQRGTGLSSPITARSLAQRGDVQKQFEYVKFFRADNIVRDCEAIRKTLTLDYPEELKRWSLFGQSFGGFCVFTYLSKHPDGLREAFTTGGIPPIGQSPDQVYQATYLKVIERNKAYYQKFPEDVKTVHHLCHHIKNEGGISLPSGIILTVQLLLTLGRNFGFHGGLDSVHQLILQMKTDLAQVNFITRPDWAAERVGKGIKEFSWLNGFPSKAPDADDLPLFFSGEMIYPFLLETSTELRNLSTLAEKLALYKDWPQLYDQTQLGENTVPVYAATFIDDMYVDYGLAQQTVHLVKNIHQYITNTMYHNAVGRKTSDIIKELFSLRDDTID